jgi:hypothetical protein
VRIEQEECELGGFKIGLRRYRREGRCLSRRNTLVRRYNMWCTPSARKSFTVVRISSKRGCNLDESGKYRAWQ